MVRTLPKISRVYPGNRSDGGWQRQRLRQIQWRRGGAQDTLHMCAIRSGSPGFFQFLTNQKTSFIIKQGKAVLTEIRLVDIGYQETLIHPLTPTACYEIG